MVDFSKALVTNKQSETPLRGVDAKKVAILAAKAQAQNANLAALVRHTPPAECKERIRIVFDDSGSMSSDIDNAKKGVVEFLRNCTPNQIAVAVHWMCTSPALPLESDLVKLGNEVLQRELELGSTPFFNTLKTALETAPQATRIVAFTDGSPTDELLAEEGMSEVCSYDWGKYGNWKASADVIIKIAGKDGPCIPIDTVFFGCSDRTREIELLKYLSDATGGFFLRFDPSKPNIWKQMKYLAPVQRLMLTSPAFRAEVEKGG